ATYAYTHKSRESANTFALLPVDHAGRGSGHRRRLPTETAQLRSPPVRGRAEPLRLLARARRTTFSHKDASAQAQRDTSRPHDKCVTRFRGDKLSRPTRYR